MYQHTKFHQNWTMLSLTVFKTAAICNLVFKKLANLDFSYGLEAKYMSLCKISLKSVKRLPRYSNV